ncbi:MAG: transposase [Desulfobacca sp.]|nr:transposase [Desulfobacca sp.]
MAWYEEVGQQLNDSGGLHADETGWRVSGQTVWLWCFTSPAATYYMIDGSRGSPVRSKFFTAALDGILITDFWSADNAVVWTGRQTCLPHLRRLSFPKNWVASSRMPSDSRRRTCQGRNINLCEPGWTTAWIISPRCPGGMRMSRDW